MNETQLLKQILEIAHQIEKSYEDKILEQDVFELQEIISSLAGSNDPNLQRLSQIAKHLHPNMSLKHFIGFIVPFERWLNRSLRDDEFLVTTEDGTSKVERAPIAVILDNIRSAFNVGSILRSLEAFGGVECIFTGYTSTPDNDKVIKTSMGTIEALSWRYFPHLDQAFSYCHNKSYKIIALETAPSSIPLNQIQLPHRSAFLMGNERFGIDNTNLLACDLVTHIPLYGVKNSLNVSIAFGIALNEWSRQWRSH